jgi:iron complex transport system permease protein
VTTVTDARPVAPSARPAPGARRRLLGRTIERGAGLVILLVAVVLVGVASLAIGSKSIPLGTVLDALRQYDATLEDHLIVHELRIPRTILALAVGAALGLAGAVMQGVTRNPLADPGILGVNAGASLAVVTAIFVLGVGSTLTTVWFALAGAALAGLLVFGLGSSGRGGATPVKLSIAGAAVSALLTAVTTSMLLLDAATLEVYRFWVVGSVAGRGMSVVWTILPFVVVGAALAIGSSRALDSMALGDDVARSLGQRVRLVRAVAAVSVIVLCGSATAAAGPIWFVGLVVPHVCRSLTGPAHRWLLPYSMCLGAILLTVADIIGRVVAHPGALEVGVVTAFLGGPIFIAFVRRRKLAEL